MTRRLALALLASSALVPGVLVPGAALAQDGPAPGPVLPSGGSVVAGNAAIGSPQGGALRIVQGSDRAIINWAGFSIGEGGQVDIVQPGSTAALLNRVTGNTTSEIAGQLNANGRVFLVNPNGILVTATGSVNAASFVASTLDIADKDFMAGSDELTVVGRRGGERVRIGRATGGYAGLVGGRTPDAGLIRAGMVEVVDGSGTKRAALDLTGDGFLQVAVPAGGIAVAGTINAREVVLSAGTAREAARGTVNLTGTIRATGIGTAGGVVTLTGDVVNLAGATIDASGTSGGGTVRIGGDWQGTGTLAHATSVAVDAATTIRADATGAGNGGRVVLWSDQATHFAGTISAKGTGGGSGGDAEVSGKATLAYAGTADLTGARFGMLLLDPYNVTISNAADSNQSSFAATGNDSVINATTLQNALATANVTVSTGAGGTQAGNITVAAPVTWASGSLLTLNAAGAIAVNAPVAVTAGGQVALTFAPTATGLTFAAGAALTFAAGQSGQSLTINGNPYTLVFTPAQLQAIGGTLAGNFALAGNIDLSGIANFTPIGTGPTPYSGRFNGLGSTISNLMINLPTTNNVGLFGATSGAITNVTLAGGSVIGNQYVGALSGASSGTVAGVSASQSVRGTGFTGGLLGSSSATLTNVSASGAVTVQGGVGRVGGLVGQSTGAVTRAFATGNVTQTTTGLRGSGSIPLYVGGLIGDAQGTVGNAYATGAVSAQANGVGGLLGSAGALVTSAYATGAVHGDYYTGGLVGAIQYGSLSQTYATGSVSGSDPSNFGQTAIGGLVGSNFTFGRVTNSYWNTTTSGVASSDGGTGLTTAQLQSGGATGLGPAFGGGAGGLYPYLNTFFPNGVQAISGTAYNATGTAVLASTANGFNAVTVNAAGAAATSSTGVDGSYYVALPNGAIAASGTSVLSYTGNENYYK